MAKRIALRGGHNYQATGANGIINEVAEDRILYPRVIYFLQLGGAEVLDVTPGNMGADADLDFGINKANSWGAELFVSIHFNNAYKTYNGALGSEVCVYREHEEAQRVCNKLGALGFKNRGQKVRTGLRELKNTNMKAMVIETCFVEATEDVKLYRSLGVDKVAKAIAEGILNKTISEPTPPPTEDKPQGELYYRVVCGSFKDKATAQKRCDELNAKGYTGTFLTAFYK